MEDPEHQQGHRMLEKCSAGPRQDQDHRRVELGLGNDPQGTTESLGGALRAVPDLRRPGFPENGETVCCRIFEILRVNRAYEAENYLVMASQKVVDRLLTKSDNVADLPNHP